MRALDEQELSLDSLSVAQGTRAMLAFFEESKPQHGEVDLLEVWWGPNNALFEFRVVRRMRRHGQPEARLELVFVFGSAGRTASGSAPATSWRDVSALSGYQAVRRARPVSRRLTQS